MVRQLKTFTQLHELLSREVQKNKGLRGVRPNLVALAERDTTGCNWSVATWSGSNGAQSETTAQLMVLVADHQKKYNATGKLPPQASPSV